VLAALVGCDLDNIIIELNCNDNIIFNNKYILNNEKQVVNICKQLNQAVKNSLNENKFPFVIGGDHSLGLGSISAFSEFYSRDDIAVIWVDAHTDIHRQDTSSSHNIHGMPLGISSDGTLNKPYEKDSAVLAKEISNYPIPWVMPENLFIIGARSIDLQETIILKDKSVNVYTTSDVKEQSINQIIDAISKKAKNKKVLLSFDVDVLDSNEFKATGLPVENGLSSQQVIEILNRLIEKTDVKYFDCVEYSQIHDQHSNLNGITKVSEIIERAYIAIKQKSI
ncbi:MAG: arginase family protein, partial [Oscillospiraceae bacterium]